MARISQLDKTPELRDFIAVHWHEGFSNQAIAEAVAREWPALEPVARTIVRWRQDDEVAEKIATMQRERITRIVRRTDAILIARLESQANELTVDELIKIRKALMPNVDAFTDEKTDKKGIITALFQKATDDPELAKALQRAVESSG